MEALLSRLPRFLSNLDRVDIAGQFDSVWNEVRETGGTLAQPSRATAQMWVLTLHGITAEGGSEEGVIVNWKREARAALSAQQGKVA